MHRPLCSIEMNNKNQICPICGFDEFDKLPSLPGISSPDLNLGCNCCGYEFDIDDRRWREVKENWIVNGWDWYPFEIEKDNWPKTVEIQLGNLNRIDFNDYVQEYKTSNSENWPYILTNQDVKNLINEFWKRY